MILLYRSHYTKYSIKQKQTIEHGVEVNSVLGVYLEQFFKIIVYVVSVHCCVIFSEIKEIIN
jgi:hypothetical protein